MRAYRTIRDVPGPVEMAVVAVPAELVPAVARDCGAAGVRALVVLSAGFAEVGEVGAELQRELLAGMPRLGHAAARAELPGRRSTPIPRYG